MEIFVLNKYLALVIMLKYMHFGCSFVYMLRILLYGLRIMKHA